MNDDTFPADRPTDSGTPGPDFVPQAPPAGPVDPYAPAPAGYGAQVPASQSQPPQSQPPQPLQQPQPPQPQQSPEPASDQPVEQHWTADGLVSTPALPPERVGRGAAYALLAVPAGALVAGLIWKIGFVASVASFVTAALAAILYVRGSGGRIKNGVFVIAAVIAVGVVVSFFTVVAVDLYGYFPKLDPDVAATYPTRWSFVRENLFYPPLLKDYTKDAALFAVFGLLGGFGTIRRLVRARALSGPVA